MNKFKQCQDIIQSVVNLVESGIRLDFQQQKEIFENENYFNELNDDELKEYVFDQIYAEIGGDENDQWTKSLESSKTFRAKGKR